MIDHDRERELLERAEAALEASVHDLDAETVARLATARRRALGSRRRGRGPALAAVGGLLAATLALAVGISWWSGPATDVADVAAIEDLEDLELVAASAELDLGEDLEFYEWLDADGLAG